jgi:hypothetical protein
VAKQSGLGDRLLVAGYNLSGDVGSIGNLSSPMTVLPATGIDKSAMERLGGEHDGSISYVAYFNKTSGQAHPRLSALPTTDQLVTYCRGASLGSPGAAMFAKQIGYDGTRAADGSLTFAVNAQLADGHVMQWGRQGTAFLRTDTTATNGASIDDGASSAFGLTAYLHVTAFSGTSVTVKLQESSDDGGSDAFADVTGGAFTAATAIGTQRIETAANLTVERYLRVVTSGTFSSATFAVLICRNEVAPL